MKSKILKTVLSVLLCGPLVAQQNTYTSAPNLRDTFDYASHSFIYNNKLYIQRSYLPLSTFFSSVKPEGSIGERYKLLPKLGITKAVFYSAQVGSKLFMVGTEYDTSLGWGNMTIYNSDLTVFKDIVFYNHLGMELDICKLDKKRNKIIVTYTYFKHKDSTNSRNWGIMELDTMGNFIWKKDILTIANMEMSDNLLVTADGGYLVSGKMNGKTTYVDPFFIKLDTNFNVIWRSDLTSTGEKFFTQDFSENLIELPNNKGYAYVGSVHRNIDTVTRKCWYYDHFTSLHFISNSGQIIKNYYHNLFNQYCEASRPKGLFLKNDSTLMIFTQRDTTKRKDRRIDSASSLVIHYNLNQHRVTKEIIGGQLLNDKINLCNFGCTVFRKHVGKDIDGGFITSGWANINDNLNGSSAYLMKTDSCGYTQDHKCKLVYRIGKQVDKSLNLTIDDSLSVLCQPIWTIEGKKYTNLDIVHAFSSWGWHRVKLWGFAGSTADSTEFDVFIDSTKTGIEPVVMNTISVYPNPASDYIEISLSTAIQSRYISGLFQHPTFTLTNLLGQSFSPPVIPASTVIPANLSGSQHHEAGISLDVRSLPTGIYLLQIRDKNDNLIKTERIVIQRDQ